MVLFYLYTGERKMKKTQNIQFTIETRQGSTATYIAKSKENLIQMATVLKRHHGAGNVRVVSVKVSELVELRNETGSVILIDKKAA